MHPQQDVQSLASGVTYQGNATDDVRTLRSTSRGSCHDSNLSNTSRGNEQADAPFAEAAFEGGDAVVVALPLGILQLVTLQHDLRRVWLQGHQLQHAARQSDAYKS